MLAPLGRYGGAVGRGGGGLRGRGGGGGGVTEEIQCHEKDAVTSVLWRVSCSLLPNNLFLTFGFVTAIVHNT